MQWGFFSMFHLPYHGISFIKVSYEGPVSFVSKLGNNQSLLLTDFKLVKVVIKLINATMLQVCSSSDLKTLDFFIVAQNFRIPNMCIVGFIFFKKVLQSEPLLPTCIKFHSQSRVRKFACGLAKKIGFFLIHIIPPPSLTTCNNLNDRNGMRRKTLLEHLLNRNLINR